MLTIVAGIDEAGYGPILGPLVVASSIFLLRENTEDLDLWYRLQNSVGKFKQGLGSRLLVTDSKKAWNRNAKTNHLERTIKGFINQLGVDRATFTSLLPIISNDLIKQAEKYPWYPSLYKDYLPEISQDVSEALTENMKQEGVEFLDFRCLCIDAEEFNRIVSTTDNKASVITSSVLKLIQQILSIAIFCAAKRIVIYVDRLGGRKFYGDLLQTLPDVKLDGVQFPADESTTCSRYFLSSGKIELDIRFEVKADNKYFPVALASMVAKYIREKILERMNEYFMKLQPGLKPTAGYWTDGWRFLEELEDETYEKSGLSMQDIVRIK